MDTNLNVGKLVLMTDVVAIIVLADVMSMIDTWAKFEECPPRSPLSLLGEGSSSLTDQSHCLNLRKNVKGNPGW